MIERIKDLPVYYEEYGEGRPVLCIHGFAVDHRLMTGCLEPFFQKTTGYRRIYLDLPGMGKTPSAPWIKTADDILAIILTFIDRLCPSERILVMGESYGGYFSLGVLTKLASRIDGLFLICPSLVPNKSERILPPKKIVWQSNQLVSQNERELDEFLEMAVIATPEIYQTYQTTIASGLKLADHDFFTNYTFHFQDESEIHQLMFDKPTTILTGRQDHVVGYVSTLAIIEQFPRASFAIMDGAGHNLQIENPELFNAYLTDWLWRLSLD